MRKLLSKLSIFMITISLTFLGFLAIAPTELLGLEYTGIGEKRFTWDREIYNGVNLNHTMSYNGNKDQKTYTIEFNPKTTNLKPVVAYGGDVMYGNTMSSLVAAEEERGSHVVFGINGDAYDTSNGVSNGLVINDGRLITTSNATYGWGMYEDGTVKYGNAKLDITAAVTGGETFSIKHVNKERKLDTNGVYLLTEDFNDVTASTQAGVEVILSANEEGLRIGSAFNLTVEEVVIVNANTEGNKTAIEKGKVVISTHEASPYYKALSELSNGTKITVNANGNNDERIDWSQVKTGMGIFHLLMENGEATSAINDPAVHPRTSMGIKTDGSIVLMQNDGRQIGWANGLSFKEMVEYMKELGVVTLFNFDGGGSSTISATIPGDDSAKVLNRPSDGHERANSNALLFIATEDKNENDPVEKLHLYVAGGTNYANKARVLENGNLDFLVTATDKNYYSKTIDNNITYTLETTEGSSIGTIDETGRFSASSGKSKGRIIARYNNEIVGTFDIEVVDSISKIETDLTIISVAPGRTLGLDFRAYDEGVPVLLSSRALSFRLDPETLGSVSENGTFTATEGQGTGNLIVSYKEYELSIPVEVGKMPMQILDFEENIFENGWNKYYTNIPNNGGAGSISINNDERFVKHGDGSLRIDYDFATKPLTGTVAIEIGESGYTTLEGQPTAIGAWIYGDGNGGWFRIQLTGGKYAGDTRINWVGWKYIETAIPKDAPFPYQVQRAIRLLGTGAIANNKKGTIYVDSVRAIYDFKNDDNDAPTYNESSVFPSEGSKTSDIQQPISLTVFDQTVEGQPKTGINTSRTELYINSKKITNLTQIVNQDGSVDISYQPGALDQLRPGKQNVRVRVEDNFGNKKFIEWSFIVEGYAVELIENVPSKDIIYANEEFTYGISSVEYRKFSSFDLEIIYNSKMLELLDSPIIDSRLIVTNLDVDKEKGIIKATIIGMENIEKGNVENIIELKFKALEEVNGTTGIKATKVTILEGSVTTDLILRGYDVKLDYKNILSYEGQTIEGNTTLKIVSEGKVVEGAEFFVTLDGDQVAFEGITNEKGELITDFFGKYPVGTKFLIKAIKDGFISNTVTLEVLESLGTNIPEKIAVTVGENLSTSVGIGWQTSHNVNNGVVEVSLSEDLANKQQFAALSKTVVTTFGGNSREYTSWGSFITGLTPNTKYYYRVGSDLDNEWSEVHSFKTAVEKGDMDVAFYGDIQGGYNNFPNIVKRLNDLYPNIEFSILAGDVADNSHIYQEWTDIDRYTKEYFNNNVWMATVGNHDVYDDAQAFTGYFYGPSNGTDGQVGARNYYFEVGDAVFFNFDTEAGYGSYDPGYKKQIALLDEVMSKTTKTFKIVIMHRSAYPLNYNESEIRALSPIFERNNIDLVLSGHDHIYSRTSMFENERVTTQNGVTYVVGGSASGSKYYDGDNTRPWVDKVYDNNNPVFTVLKFREGNKIEFIAYAVENGENVVVDEFVISKQNINVTGNNATYEGDYAIKTGASHTFNVISKFGYKISKVLINGIEVNQENGVYTVANVQEAINIEIITEKIEGIIYDVNQDRTTDLDDAKAILKHITGKELLSNEVIEYLKSENKELNLSFVRELLEVLGDK